MDFFCGICCLERYKLQSYFARGNDIVFKSLTKYVKLFYVMNIFIN